MISINTPVVSHQVWFRPHSNLNFQGNWEQYFPIPRDRGGYDTFEILREQLDSKLKELLEEDIEPEDSNSTRSVKILFKSCMNTEIIEERKEEPLLNLLR